MNWQSIIASLLVTVAAWWIGRRVYRTIKRLASGQPGGGGCGSCERNPNNQASPNVISLEQVKRATRDD